MQSSRIAFSVLLVVCFSTACQGRRLQQEQQPAETVAAAEQRGAEAITRLVPVQIGDGSARVLSKPYFSKRGGAMRALGRSTIADLKRASGYRGSVSALAREMDHDSDLAVDAVHKTLMYVCEGMATSAQNMVATASATAAAVTTGVAATAEDASIPSSQAFSLSSRPSAAKKIYLDFDGHTTVNTFWNTIKGIASIVTPAYDTDGNPTSFSTSELNDIIAMWRAVSEDYAMFDVDVTTIEPVEALASANAVRAVVGGDYSDWWGSAAGGVAYVGSFSNATQPREAFVFAKNLGPNFVKYVWEAISHEVGHTLGLSHDGTSTSAYYSGQGDWAPIMGSAYGKTITTFDKGEFTGATNLQDDIQVINAKLPLLPQPATSGSSLASAVALAPAVDSATGLATAKAAGVVSTSEGAWFSFTAAAGTATLSAAVVSATLASGSTYNRANLDVQLTVYGPSGAVLATINPSSSLAVPASPVTLPTSGVYTIQVSGAGSGTVATGGYSSYGSRGQFELSAVYTPCADCVTATPASPAPVESSPSPTPEQPSPSPSPAPVPSPSPAPQPMLRITSISIARLKANTAGTSIYCTITMTIRDAAGLALANVRTNGQWTLAPVGGAVSTSATAFVNSGSAGTVSFRSATMANVVGSTCTFSVLGATLAGYQLDPTSVVTRTSTVV